eukprot:scaffold1178_cov252-Pinguiococcus_pyrenoidosus.AAC.37
MDSTPSDRSSPPTPVDGPAKYRPKALNLGAAPARPASAAEVAFQNISRRRDSARKTGWSDSLRDSASPATTPVGLGRRGLLKSRFGVPSPASSVASGASDEMEIDEALRQFRDPKMRAYVAKHYSCSEGSRSSRSSPAVTPTNATTHAKSSAQRSKQLRRYATCTSSTREVDTKIMKTLAPTARSPLGQIHPNTHRSYGEPSFQAFKKKKSVVRKTTTVMPSLDGDHELRDEFTGERQTFFTADISSIMVTEGLESRMLESQRSLLQSFRGEETLEVVNFFQNEEFAGESRVCIDSMFEEGSGASQFSGKPSEEEEEEKHAGITEKELEKHNASMEAMEEKKICTAKAPKPNEAAVPNPQGTDSEESKELTETLPPLPMDELQDVASEGVDRISLGSSSTRPSSITAMSLASKMKAFEDEKQLLQSKSSRSIYGNLLNATASEKTLQSKSGRSIYGNLLNSTAFEKTLQSKSGRSIYGNLLNSTNSQGMSEWRKRHFLPRKLRSPRICRQRGARSKSQSIAMLASVAVGILMACLLHVVVVRYSFVGISQLESSRSASFKAGGPDPIDPFAPRGPMAPDETGGLLFASEDAYTSGKARPDGRGVVPRSQEALSAVQLGGKRLGTRKGPAMIGGILVGLLGLNGTASGLGKLLHFLMSVVKGVPKAVGRAILKAAHTISGRKGDKLSSPVEHLKRTHELNVSPAKKLPASVGIFEDAM